MSTMPGISGMSGMSGMSGTPGMTGMSGMSGMPGTPFTGSPLLSNPFWPWWAGQSLFAISAASGGTWPWAPWYSTPPWWTTAAFDPAESDRRRFDPFERRSGTSGATLRGRRLLISTMWRSDLAFRGARGLEMFRCHNRQVHTGRSPASKVKAWRMPERSMTTKLVASVNENRLVTGPVGPANHMLLIRAGHADAAEAQDTVRTRL